MAQLVYAICFSEIGEIVVVLEDHVNVAFHLTSGLVVEGGGHLKLNVKDFQELLPEVQGESTVSVRDNREGVFMNSEYLVQNDLDSLFSIDILGDRK
jgi:hypothetical protein